MRTKRIIAALALGVSVLSCVRQEPVAPESAVTLAVGEYPAFTEPGATGIPDSGKTEWQNGDVLYIVLQTAESPVAARYRAVRTSGSWDNFEEYADGAYARVASLTAPGASKALVFYAPAYEFKEDAMLGLQSGKVAGVDEFLQWSSGEGYDITGTTLLDVDFVRDYSRLRVVTGNNFSVRLKAPAFIPAGHGTSALRTTTLDAVADGSGNAFYYGSWPAGTPFDLSTYDTGGSLSYSNVFSDIPAGKNGTSYVLECCNPGEYTSISELCAMAGTSDRSFDVKFRNVVVSYAIDSYVHLEDNSGAILVYVSGLGLRAGQSITGTVKGTVKKYNGLPEITAFDYSGADVSSGAAIPGTEMALDALLNDFEANLSRRIILKDITIDKGIQGGSTSKRTGKISQNGSTITIYGTLSSSPAVLGSGLSGDLVAFPTMYKSEKQLSIYESDQFTEGGGVDPEDTAFARLTLMGFYANTDTDSPSPVMTYVECADQYSYGSGSGKSFYHQFNLENGTYGMVDLNSASYNIGSEFSVTVNLNGISQVHSVKVVNKNSTMAWLEDKTDNVGYIIAR